MDKKTKEILFLLMLLLWVVGCGAPSTGVTDLHGGNSQGESSALFVADQVSGQMELTRTSALDVANITSPTGYFYRVDGFENGIPMQNSDDRRGSVALSRWYGIFGFIPVSDNPADLQGSEPILVAVPIELVEDHLEELLVEIRGRILSFRAKAQRSHSAGELASYHVQAGSDVVVYIVSEIIFRKSESNRQGGLETYDSSY